MYQYKSMKWIHLDQSKLFCRESKGSGFYSVLVCLK